MEEKLALSKKWPMCTMFTFTTSTKASSTEKVSL